MPRSTGFPGADAGDDFQRVRRRQVVARLARRLRREPDDVGVVLPFDEVVEALGMTGTHHVGHRVIAIHDIVGSVDRSRDFDRTWRPTSGRAQLRWERIATAQRRGDPLPPISVYRVEDLYFVRDGHHRVSVARAMGQRTIEADVTDITVQLDTSGIRSRSDLITKSYERLFAERVPLPADVRATLEVDDAWSWCVLAETVEAWGFRLMQVEQHVLTRPDVAVRWYHDEYRRVVRMLRAADLIEDRTEVETYLTIAAERYRLIRTHEWNDEVIDRLRDQLLR